MHLGPLTDLYGTPGAPMLTTHFDLVSGPFWAPRDQVWSRLPPIGPPWMDSCSPHTLTWYRAPSGSPGAKKGYLALIPKFPRPNFVRDIFFFKYRLVGCPEHRSGMPYSSSTVIAHLEPPSSRKRSKTDKKGLFGPQNSLLVFYVIELYSIVLYGIACYFIVLHGTA